MHDSIFYFIQIFPFDKTLTKTIWDVLYDVIIHVSNNK